MNLQELLLSFEIDEDKIKQINKAVDEVIERKLVGKEDEIKAIEDELTKTKTDLDSANTELQPVRDSAKKEQLATLMPENADPNKHEDIVALSNISEEDDEEAIKTKLANTVDSRDYLKKPTTEDPTVAKPKVDETNKKPVDNSAKMPMPTGVK